MKKAIILLSLLVMATIQIMAGVVVGNTYRIVPVSKPKMSLFVKDAGTSVNVEVQLWTETNVPAQQWTLGAVNDSLFSFKNVYTERYIGYSSTTKNGYTRQVSGASGGRWRLIPVDEENSIYRMMPYTGNNSLTIPDDAADGKRPAMAATEEGNDKQLWQLIEVNPISVFESALREQMMDNFINVFVQKYGSYKSFGKGGWGNAEMLEVCLDAYEATGQQKYLDLCKSDYNHFKQYVGDSWNKLVYDNNYNWFGHDFNDDVMWEIIAVSRMAWLTGEKQYLTAAKRNFDTIYKRAYISSLGLMRWAESSGDRNGSNSCINGPTEVAACYLGMAGAGEEYFEKARDLYALQRQYLANMTTGQVYDSFVWDPDTKKVKSRNDWASTYNQGTMLGAAVLLYEHYGDAQYRNDAEKIMSYTVKNLCDKDGIISVCQVNDGDLCGFKGIFMRYARRYVLDLNVGKYQEWTKKNAFRAFNNSDDRGVTTSKWLTKATRDVATNAFSCSTAASAGVNAVTGLVQKDAFAVTDASTFDYHRCVFTVDDGMGGRVLSVKNGGWTAYDNMDFGDTPAQCLVLTIPSYPYDVDGSVEVCLDKYDAEPIGTLPLTQADADGKTVYIAITPTTGIHHVFIRYNFRTASRPNAYQISTLQFSTQTAEELSDGIDIPLADEEETIIYDMLGRRISRGDMQQGLYIVNGKKVMVK